MTTPAPATSTEPTTAEDITIGNLAAELSLSIASVSHIVTALILKDGHRAVVRTAADTNRATLLHGPAADRIRTNVAAAVNAGR